MSTGNKSVDEGQGLQGCSLPLLQGDGRTEQMSQLSIRPHVSAFLKTSPSPSLLHSPARVSPS